MTERELLAAAKAGDRHAEDRLMRDYEGLVFYVCHPFNYPGAEREDVHQDGRVGLANAIRAFDPAGTTPFRNFAGLCIKRSVISNLKAHKRLKHDPLTRSIREGVNEEGERLAIVDLLSSPHELDPYMVVLAKERVEALKLAMGHLTALERRAMLGVANGQSYAEIEGCEAGSKPKWVDNAVQRARLKLRDAA